MKKNIFILIMVLVMFVSCSNVSSLEDESLENEKSTYKVSDFIDLKVVAFNLYETVYVDKNTGILYYRKNVKNGGSGGYTPIYNVDGSLKNINQYK